MNPATRKALIAQEKWDVAQLHEIEKRQREAARIASLARRERATDESEPGVVVTHRPSAKARRGGSKQRTERFYTEKAGNHWAWLMKEVE
jgi:hypothetical protein